MSHLFTRSHNYIYFVLYYYLARGWGHHLVHPWPPLLINAYHTLCDSADDSLRIGLVHLNALPPCRSNVFTALFSPEPAPHHTAKNKTGQGYQNKSATPQRLFLDEVIDELKVIRLGDRIIVRAIGYGAPSYAFRSAH